LAARYRGESLYGREIFFQAFFSDDDLSSKASPEARPSGLPPGTTLGPFSSLPELVFRYLLTM